MCGRYVSVSSPEELAEHFEVQETTTDGLGRRWNVAPSLDVYAVIEREGSRALGTLRWGFVPYWAASIRKAPTPINVRVETIHTKRMFVDAFQRRRCLLPADGFYEWQETAEGRKQPWFVRHRDGEPLALAGIWERWQPRDESGEPDGDPVWSTAIVTTAAVGRMAELHDRMPVALPKRLWADWLADDEVPAGRLQEVVAGAEPPPLEARRVSTRVNDVRNDGPELLDPPEDA